MSLFEIISGILLLVASVIIVCVVLMQEHKQADLSGSITGSVSSQDSYFGKNKSRTKEAVLKRITTYCAVAFFVLTLLVNFFGVFFK